jgi:uncharacterized membrane protein HdeD (DUF308 family)
MEKEDLDKLFDIASRSRLYTALVGVLLLIIGIVFFLFGGEAIVLEITATGILMIVFGTHKLLTAGVKDKDSILMIILGILFVVFVFVFEVLHGLMLILEFLSTGLIFLWTALGQRKGNYGRKTSLVIGIGSLIIAVGLIVAHEESLDIIITVMGAILIALSIYVLWCAAKNKPAINPITYDGP